MRRGPFAAGSGKRFYSVKPDSTSLTRPSTAAVSNDTDRRAADNAERQDTEQALGVDAALLLFDPDGGFVFIRLLNKERSGTRVQANLVLNSDFFDKHFNTPLLP